MSRNGPGQDGSVEARLTSGKGLPRRWQLGALILLAILSGLRFGATVTERIIAGRLETAARRAGVMVRYERLQVGLSPAFLIKGLSVEKPGVMRALVDEISVVPTFRGPRGFGLRGRVAVGRAQVSLPAGISASFHKTAWEVDPGHSITLTAPAEGLSFAQRTGPRGRAFDAVATALNLDALVVVAVEGDVSRGLGFLTGSVHIEGDPGRDFQATWRSAALGGDSGGSLIVIPGGPDQKVQFQASMRGLDFAHILRSLGVEADKGRAALGSLSGTVSVGGLLHDPKSLEVIQRIEFKRPRNVPPEVIRLRGAFTHEVTTNAGVPKVIPVGPESADFIALADVPPLFLRALLIAEDAGFWGHPGIDLTELPKAIATNMARGEAVRGASTLTQQLAKNLFLTREKSLQRKLKELSYAFLLESSLGKPRILEIYLNVIEWGPGLYGLRPAAAHYFAKEPAALSPREIAFLVSMIPGPIKYQQSIQGGEVKGGFDTLVNNLLVKLRSVDALTEEEYEAARAQKLVFRGLPTLVTEPTPEPGA